MPPQDNSASSSWSGDDPDDSLVGENGSNPENDVQETVDANEWAAATAEGYTPLADMGDSGAVFMAYPTSNDNSTGGGVFFADLSAFDAVQDDNDDDQVSDEQQELVIQSEQQQPTSAVEQADFRAIAHGALSSLEREYAMTIHAGEQTVEQSDTTRTNEINDTSEDESDASGENNNTDSNPLPAPLSVLEERELPPIDTEAVRRAVESIRLKAPDFCTNLDKGASEKKQQQLGHDVIPSAPLAAFSKRTPKAIRATANLSRSATIAEALCRIGYFTTFKKEASQSLVIHVLGADPVECDTDERVRILFGPLVRWVGALTTTTTSTPTHVVINLVGPNLEASCKSRTVDLMPTTKSRLGSARASFYGGLYHDYMTHAKQQGTWQPPDVAVAFNAGVWGYRDWRPTLESLCSNKNEAIPLVITSYTMQEAEDDADVVQEIVQEKQSLLWGPEANPFGSKQKRDTATAIQGREYRENAAWQAWMLGGTCALKDKE